MTAVENRSDQGEEVDPDRNNGLEPVTSSRRRAKSTRIPWKAKGFQVQDDGGEEVVDIRANPNPVSLMNIDHPYSDIDSKDRVEGCLSRARVESHDRHLWVAGEREGEGVGEEENGVASTRLSFPATSTPPPSIWFAFPTLLLYACTTFSYAAVRTTLPLMRTDPLLHMSSRGAVWYLSSGSAGLVIGKVSSFINFLALPAFSPPYPPPPFFFPFFLFTPLP